jgi:hypothetical protein
MARRDGSTSVRNSGSRWGLHQQFSTTGIPSVASLIAALMTASGSTVKEGLGSSGGRGGGKAPVVLMGVSRQHESGGELKLGESARCNADCRRSSIGDRCRRFWIPCSQDQITRSKVPESHPIVTPVVPASTDNREASLASGRLSLVRPSVVRSVRSEKFLAGQLIHAGQPENVDERGQRTVKETRQREKRRGDDQSTQPSRNKRGRSRREDGRKRPGVRYSRFS